MKGNIIKPFTSRLSITRSSSVSIKALITSLPVILLAALVIRLGVYLWLHQAGYFYGLAYDTFTRTLQAYYWSHHPVFSYDDYWLPLQTWLVGSAYRLLMYWVKGPEILVPVAINNVFLIGSLIITFKVGEKIGGKMVGVVACLLAAVFAGDVFISYTALSEPILVFFILLGGYYLIEFYQAPEDHRGGVALKLGLISFLLSATHYIGWFAAFIVCILLLPGMISSLREKRWKLLSRYLIAISLCVVMPLFWLLNSYMSSGDFFQAIQVAKTYQAGHIGKLDVGTRLIAPAQAMITNFPALTLTGCVAIFMAYKQKRWALLYIAVPGFILGMIWLSTALAMSAPYEEPRYLVFWGWAIIPLIALMTIILWQRSGHLGKIISSAVLLLIVTSNLLDIHAFKNSFGPDVRAAGAKAEIFLRENPTGCVILEVGSVEDDIVIPTIANDPGRTRSIKRKAFRENSENLDGFFYSFCSPWLVIMGHRDIAKAARSQDLSVNQVGNYFLISPPGK